MKKLAVIVLALSILLIAAAPAFASPLSKAMSVDRPHATAVTYAPQRAIAGERATKPYPSYTYYSELGAILARIDRQSARVTVRQFATSAGGHPLWLVTIQKKWASPAARQRWLRFIRLQTEDPAAALAMLKKGGDLRVPVFINNSIHGGETTGVDAGLMLLKKLAFGNDAATRRILDNCVVMINAVQNPDGRITDLRQNANGFDLNRDWVVQTQPEVRAVARQIVKWHPTLFLDTHGYYDPMVIDPTTNPHNPNYEWDLSLKWALPAALAMEKAIEDNSIVEVDIPYRDWINPETGKSEGFEDYSPYYTPQFAMYYGLVGSTMETSYKSEDGVDAHYYGILEGAKYAAANRVGMLKAQLARFLRGVKGISQPATADIPTPLDYAYAYVIPVDDARQADPLQARHAVRHLINNGIKVYRATADFTVPAPIGVGASQVNGDNVYPAGSYIVPLKQPLRGVANALLWDGEDISDRANEMYDACAWQLPESWGFTREEVLEPFAATRVRVRTAADAAGTVVGTGPTFVLANTNNNAVKAANALLAGGLLVDRVVGNAPARVAGNGAAAVPLGAYVVNAPQARVRDLLVSTAQRYKVDFQTADLTGIATQQLYNVDRRGAMTGVLKVGVYSDDPTWYALTRLGFDAERMAADADLSAYDVIVVEDPSGLDVDAVKTWIEGGGAYIANGPYGIIDGVLRVTPKGGYDWDFYWANNCLGSTAYAEGSLVAAGYGPNGYTFAFPITWFQVDDPVAVAVDAAYGDWYFLAGYWQIGDPTGWVQADAAAQPIVVHGYYGSGRVTFCGPMTAFRAGTEATFRLLSNAIYTASYDDRPPI
ncbi:MAG: M14 family metallopeptidase [Thermoleophilia bacterium]